MAYIEALEHKSCLGDRALHWHPEMLLAAPYSLYSKFSSLKSCYKVSHINVRENRNTTSLKAIAQTADNALEPRLPTLPLHGS